MQGLPISHSKINNTRDDLEKVPLKEVDVHSKTEHKQKWADNLIKKICFIKLLMLANMLCMRLCSLLAIIIKGVAEAFILLPNGHRERSTRVIDCFILLNRIKCNNERQM